MTQLWRKVPDMTHEEWLQWRKGGIGSSDAASILGYPTAFGTPYSVWESILFDKQKEENYAMSRGKALEPVARCEFNRLMSVETKAANVENIEMPWLRASLDGIDDNGQVMVEIKAPGRIDHSIAMNDIVPDKYYIQCQHQLAVTGLPGMYYFSFDGTEGKVVEVIRDSVLIEKLIDEERKFWAYVLSGEAPPLTERDYVSLEDERLLTEFIENRRQLKALEELDKSLLDGLKIKAAGLSFQGQGIKFTKSLCKGPIDYKRACDENNISLDSYRKPSYIKWTPSGI